jgi:hypothetical protein
VKEFPDIPELPDGLSMLFREDLIADVKKIIDDPYEREV